MAYSSELNLLWDGSVSGNRNAIRYEYLHREQNS